MARTLAGAPFRSFRTRLGDQPEGVTTEEWESARATADRVYVDMAETIDFARVLIEANKRHLSLHPEKKTMLAAADIGVMSVEALCHECLREVFLATNTNPPWTEEAESPRYLLYVEPEGEGLRTPVARDPFSGGAALGDWDDDGSFTDD